MSIFSTHLLIMSCLFFSCSVLAGPFPPAAGQPGTTAISATDASIQAWATGYQNYAAGPNVDPEWQDPQRALLSAGDSDNDGIVATDDYTFDIVSLGQGGQITLTFDTPITDGDGFDFVIFENSNVPGFLELAWVEVSSNGIDFVRFPAASLTPTAVGPFASTMSADDIDGLAGKYLGGYGTPFDLSLLSGNALLDTDSITHVRIIDIVGDGSAIDDLTAPDGPNIIYDPYPTAGSAGFDLDAVGVLNLQQTVFEQNVPLPTAYLALFAALLIGTYSLTTAATKKRYAKS